MFLFFSFFCLSLWMYVCLSVCLSVCLFVCLFSCLYDCLIVCLSVCLSVYVDNKKYKSIYIAKHTTYIVCIYIFFYLFISISIYLSICLYICLCMHLSIYIYYYHWSFEYMVWDIENWRNLCSLLVTSLSGISNTFTPLCHSTIISGNWTSRRVTIQTLDVQYKTHLYAIVYPGPVFYHLAFIYIYLTLAWIVWLQMHV